MKSSFSPSPNKIRITKHLNKALQSTPPEKSENNLFYLPPIDSEAKKKAFNEPSSILTKFVEKRTKNLIRSTREELKKPIRINIISSMDKSKDLNRNKSLNKKLINQKFFITDNPNKNSKKDLDSNSNINDSQSTKKNYFVSEIDNLTSLTIDHAIREGKLNALIPKFRRTRIYQPIISENWKFKNGLRVTIGTQKMNSLPIKNDIEYQYKIINDEYRLLEDNYIYYRQRILIKNNYYESFSSMPLASKIKYNKSLEETIGILYILPQLLLVEFYKLIKNYSSVSIPNSDLFKEKYVFDEVKTLKYNNSLLIKVYEFFKSCYEVYGTLIKEVNDMCLNNNNFINVINCFEKARFNLSYIATSSLNAIKNYNNDIKYIQIIKNDKEEFHSIDVTEKMRNQFSFKKNDEKQRRLRIETALDNKHDNDNYSEDIKKRDDSIGKNRFTSFIESKLINGLMKHFTKEVKNEINTQKINKEIDGNYDDGEEIRTKHRVVKINI